MKKLLYILILAALLIGTALAVQPYHEVEVVDERGVRVVDITSVEIYAPDTTTNAVIYSDRAEQNTITIPMTESSTNTTLVDGFMTWYGPDGYDFSITDGTNVLTNANHRTRTSSEGTLVFPSYITSITTSQYLDAESITMGTSSDWVVNAGTTPDLLTWTPATDGAVFRIGLAAGTKSADFQVYTAAGVGLLIDEGTNVLGITGLTTSINASSNYDTNICTGSSTGATTIGNAAGGALVVDTDSTLSINADDSIAMTVSAGTIGIASTGGDLTIDATDKSVIIRGTEEAADAILLDADGTAGGIELQCGTGDITLDSGDDIFLEANTGTGDVISIINTKGTATGAMVIQCAAAGGDINVNSVLGSVYIEGEEDVANAVLITSDGGTSSGLILLNDTGTGDESILLDSDVGGITINANAGSIDIEAVGGTDGDIGINAGDDMTITAAGDLTFAVTGATVLPDDVLLKATVAVTANEADNLAATQKELVAAVAGKMHEFVKVIVALDWGTTAYTESDDNLVVRYTDGSGVIVSDVIEATGLADATEDTVCFAGPAPTTSALVTEAASTNQALVLDNSGNGEWGNSGDSPLVVIIYYRTHTTAELGL